MLVRWARRLGLAAVAIFLAVNFAVAGLVLYLQTSLPTVEGTVTLPTLSAPVEVARDPRGVPRIRAETPRDAYVALGYVHAQDRLWQMEAMRRVGAGRMAELVGRVSSSLGERVLSIDKLMRTLGLHRRAAAIHDRLPADAKDMLDAYAEGVNAFIEGHDGAWPIEFTLLMHTPEPWTPADSIVWQGLMSLRLGGDWTDELMRARLLKLGLAPERIEIFWTQEPEDASVPTASHAGILDGLSNSALAAIAQGLTDDLIGSGASNAWAVTGPRTEGGGALVANDPHLGFTLPNLWYLVHIEAPGMLRVGATVPGVPILVLGHNGDVGWGMTTPNIDSQDLYVETIDPADPTRYRTPNGWASFDSRVETVLVGSREVEHVVRESRHGPVISGVWPGTEVAGDGAVLALASPFFAADDASVEGLLELNRATDLDEAIEAIGKFHAPAQNITLGDGDGRIAMVAAGRLPVRRDHDGRLPADGASDDGDWLGWAPFDAMPAVIDPPESAVVQANNRIVPRDPSLHLGGAFDASYRARRIAEQITRSGQTRDHMVEVQMDTVSTMAREMKPLLLDTVSRMSGETARVAEALLLLRRWDGDMAADRPEPLILVAWLRHLAHGLFGDDAGALYGELRRVPALAIRRALEGAGDWCDDIRTPGRESCDTEVEAALTKALDELAALHGPRISAWRWGQAHAARFEHRILARIPYLGHLFKLELPVGGGDYTVNRGAFSGDGDNPYAAIHGAGYRAVYDMASPDRSLFSSAVGQSGNVFSENFEDMADDWAGGRYHTIDRDPGPAARRLTLRPDAN